MGSLFSKPKVDKQVQRMPDEEDPVVLDAQARQRAAVQARSGRASTMLSRNNRSNGNGTGAGTGAYGNSLLGQAG